VKRSHWDIFCQVIDNYGDIGTAWRLARQLVSEHAIEVRLWVDDLTAFRQLWPEIRLDAAIQYCQGVEVRVWGPVFPAVSPALVVIEAFGCPLPPVFLAAMRTQFPPAVWINLEYLSAEAWVETHHALPSPHPDLPLTKFFFFPGYQSGTGGVLREQDLAQRRAHFQRAEIPAFWQSLGLRHTGPAELRISLFAYPNAALPALLDALAHSNHAVTCLVPEGVIVSQIAAWLGETMLPVGAVARRGALTLHILPFLNQDNYDRLLWACDINFVRGEDSCVRAQWAQKAFVWQPYPQTENAHWDKLDALTRLYVEGLPKVEAQSVIALWQAWNGRGDLAQAWADFIQVMPAIEMHAKRWVGRLAEPGDLAANLVAFVEDREAG
jgi:uncharacterized repeat protein (TIGR03837 family)